MKSLVRCLLWRLGRIAIVLGAILALSTLTTKQHFIADVISGYALTFIACAFALRGWRGPEKLAAPAAAVDVDVDHLGAGRTG